jgi:hypothetical protein
MLTRLRVVRLMAKAGLLLACAAPVSFAQEPIRVETNQVVVPTVVFDKKLYEHKKDLAAQVDKNPHFWDTIAITNLIATDFHLSEDGHDQSIVSVKLEAPTSAMVQDNWGRHVESVGTGGGRWGHPDTTALTFSFPHYVLTYLPPVSPPGSCHQVMVTVGHPNLEVYTRSEYCNTKHPATDPLNGTEFGQKLEQQLAQPNDGKIDLAARAFAFYDASGESRAHLGLEFRPQSLKHEMREDRLYATIGLLGMVYGHDGTLLTRFSDFACCDYGHQKTSLWKTWTAAPPEQRNTSLLPLRYDTQIDLAPGDYVVEVLLSDGENFGRRKILLHVDNFTAGELGISEIALCRRIRAAATAPADVPMTPSGRYIPLVSKGAEYVPAADARVVKYGQFPIPNLYFYFEIYAPSPGGAAGPSLQAQTRLIDLRTGNIKVDYGAVDALPYRIAGSPFVFIGRGLRLDELDPGSYELQVQATDAAGHSTPWKKAAFTIEFVKSITLKDYPLQ